MAAATAAEPVYLVDASIYIFQAHFSPYVECYDSDGEDLSALFGFLQFLLQLRKRTAASYLGVAHDESLFQGFRHDLCESYKSNRELPDDNLARQLEGCMVACEVLGVAAYGSRRYEADDIIGTLTRLCQDDRRQQGSHSPDKPEASAVAIVSRDKDLSQLLSGDADYVWDYNANRRRYRSDVFAELGIYPEQIPDYLGLVGDSVDCITGVPGVGPVKATVLLQHFEDLDGIYANLHKVSQLPLRGAAGLAKKLAAHRELAELSKQLATIVCDIGDTNESCTGVVREDLAVRDIDNPGLERLLSEYRFNKISASRIRDLAANLA